jgi:hypothetical protein
MIHCGFVDVNQKRSDGETIMLSLQSRNAPICTTLTISYEKMPSYVGEEKSNLLRINHVV